MESLKLSNIYVQKNVNNALHDTYQEPYLKRQYYHSYIHKNFTWPLQTLGHQIHHHYLVLLPGNVDCKGRAKRSHCNKERDGLNPWNYQVILNSTRGLESNKVKEYSSLGGKYFSIKQIFN